MPIASTLSFTRKKKSLLIQLHKIFKGMVLDLQDEGKALTIVFAMDLHFIKAGEIDKLKFGSPEGIRLLVRGKTTFAVDFLFFRKGMHLIQILQGIHLDQFITSLNSIGSELRNERHPCYIDCLQFLFTSGHYLMARKSSKSIFYKFDDKLKKVSHALLRRELSKIVDNRKREYQPLTVKL